MKNDSFQLSTLSNDSYSFVLCSNIFYSYVAQFTKAKHVNSFKYLVEFVFIYSLYSLSIKKENFITHLVPTNKLCNEIPIDIEKYTAQCTLVTYLWSYEYVVNISIS